MRAGQVGYRSLIVFMQLLSDYSFVLLWRNQQVNIVLIGQMYGPARF